MWLVKEKQGLMPKASLKILPNLKASHEKDLLRVFPSLATNPKSLHDITINEPVLEETF